MANHKSAAKRARQTAKRTERNRGIKSKVKTAIRAFREALAQNDEAAGSKLQAAARELRRAASKGVIAKRNASRRVSRLEASLHASK